MLKIFLSLLFIGIYSYVFCEQEIVTDKIIVKLKRKTSFSNFSKKIKTLSLQNVTKLSVDLQKDDDVFIIQLDNFKNINELNYIIERLSKEIEFDYIEPLKVARPAFVPNDPFYSNQWHFDSSSQYPSAINLGLAWDITKGSSSSIVAILDTGILNHSDLSSSKFLAGYDMISFSSIANDGDGRDNNPQDPGDWCSVSERNNNSPNNLCYDPSCAPNCNTQINSSWHGLFVTGIIFEDTNNSNMGAGINWYGKVLPVRVLGKGGGYVSDIADGVKWACGGSVDGIPNNQNSAKIINMSLGGVGSCPTYLQQAIDFCVNQGAVVVVAAGNRGEDVSNFFPANCSNVIAVSALDKNGNRASYSNYGSLVFISAPGGSYWEPIYSISNGGYTSPGNDIFTGMLGTSMAAPNVSGIISLMLSFKPSLTRQQILYNLRKTARQFSMYSNCNTSICGVGIIDAYAALDNLVISISSTTPSSGENSGNLPLVLWGKGFLNDAIVKLKRQGYSDILCNNVNVVNLNQINCTLPLSGATTGQWSVEVINVDGSSSILSNYFTITGFTVSSINPESAFNSNSPVSMTISGTGFVSPMVVRLKKTGYSDILCSNVVVLSSNTATCNLNVLGAFSGLRDVEIINGDGKMQNLLNAFMINNATPSVYSISPDYSFNDLVVDIIIRGSGFYPHSTAKLSKPGFKDINCSMSVYSSTYAICRADLLGSFSGVRDFVMHISTTNFMLVDGFNILNSSLYISSIYPPSALNNNSNVNVEVKGKGFTFTTSAKLSKTGYNDINTSNTQVITSTYMIVSFNLLNVPSGKRNFIVYYGTTSYIKTDGFNIVDTLTPPHISMIEPKFSFNNLNPVINIYGDNFLGGLSIKVFNDLNEISVSNFSLVSSTAIINAVLPIKGYHQSKWGIKIINPDGKFALLPNAFSLLEVKEEVKVYESVINVNNNQKARIVYEIPSPALVIITIYNNLGEKIMELYRGNSQSGLNEIEWDGKDNFGRFVKNGVYIVEVSTPFYKKYKRVVIVR